MPRHIRRTYPPSLSNSDRTKAEAGRFPGNPRQANEAVLRGSGDEEHHRAGRNEIPQQTALQLQHIQRRRNHCRVEIGHSEICAITIELMHRIQQGSHVGP